jgi:hypothetical protein
MVKNKIEFKVSTQGNNEKAYRECEAFIGKWKEILRIQDWRIELHFLTKHEIDDLTGNSTDVACCAVNRNLKSARISVNIEDTDVNDGLEETLIHELLHIVFDGIEEIVKMCADGHGKLERLAFTRMEQTVEALALSFAKVANL